MRLQVCLIYSFIGTKSSISTLQAGYCSTVRSKQPELSVCADLQQHLHDCILVLKEELKL